MDASIPDAFQDLVEVGILASAREPFDPMEKAFHELRLKSAPETAEPATAASSSPTSTGFAPICSP